MIVDAPGGMSGKGVLVTGAAGGIGSAVCERFAAAGAHVVLSDVDATAVNAVASQLPGTGHSALAYDLTDIAGLDAFVDQAVERLGRIDVLAHIAAVFLRQSSIEDVTERDWDLQHDVNLKASFFLSRAVARKMQAQRTGGRIILFSSQSWWTGGLPGAVVYAASKGGIVSLTRGLARVYGRDNITVNAIAPGLIDTAMGRHGLSAAAIDESVKAAFLGRWGTPREIAGAVLFLAGDDGGFITGTTINVSGGALVY
jgi:NAD(P)-dependent dehydrogenase (short-subunit alcohol dehydrogenase family)